MVMYYRYLLNLNDSPYKIKGIIVSIYADAECNWELNNAFI